MAERYLGVRQALGAATMDTILSSKILVVGAGGIGCELLKNLVLTGFEKIETVDLDTIDVSNLNRQFLFRRAHVGMPKAVVARDAATKFNPRCEIVAHHANIKSSEFNIAWFKSFSAVVNALDNVDARRHVNRMCLASGVPLIEAGTTGYLGQVFSIQKSVTACYECFPKPTPTVYPICTIRATPNKPVHCIVWAKELFKLLFGSRPEDSMLFEDASVEKDSAYQAIALAVREDRRRNVSELLEALFRTDVVKQLAAGKYQTADQKPEPLDGLDQDIRAPARAEADGWDRRAWSVAEAAAQFRASMLEINTTEFDKDDDATMLFVTAAANLRCANFKIEPQSFFTAKGIAGNIVPAIATTNAIVAGLQVAALVAILSRRPDQTIKDVCRYTYCLRDPTRKGLILQPTALDPPQPSCYVCRAGRVTVAIDTKLVTLREFVKDVVQAKLNFVNPAIDIGDCGIYDEEDERLATNLALPLAKLPAGGLGDSAACKATDYATDLELTILIKHQENLEDGHQIITDSDEQRQQQQEKRSLPENDDEHVVKRAKIDQTNGSV